MSSIPAASVPAGTPADAAPTRGAAGPDVAPRWIRPAILINLICEIAIVGTGGLVRLTGSGLGCPTWPQCVPGSFTPVPYQAQGYHKYIEYGNRTLTSVLVAAAVVALFASISYCRHTGAGKQLLVLGAMPLALVFVQAVIGGVSVLMGLSPVWVSLHFLASMVVVALSTLLYLAVGRGTVPSDSRELRWMTGAVAALTPVLLVLGAVVTGSGPHSGDDATRPARFGFNPRDVSWLHADTVMLFVGLVVALVITARLTRADATLVRRTYWLLAVTLAQGVIGYVQYFTQLPTLLVILHMLGASLLTLTVTAVVSGVTGDRILAGRPAIPSA